MIFCRLKSDFDIYDIVCNGGVRLVCIDRLQQLLITSLTQPIQQRVSSTDIKIQRNHTQTNKQNKYQLKQQHNCMYYHLYGQPFLQGELGWQSSNYLPLDGSAEYVSHDADRQPLSSTTATQATVFEPMFNVSTSKQHHIIIQAQNFLFYKLYQLSVLEYIVVLLGVIMTIYFGKSEHAHHSLEVGFQGINVSGQKRQNKLEYLSVNFSDKYLVLDYLNYQIIPLKHSSQPDPTPQIIIATASDWQFIDSNFPQLFQSQSETSFSSSYPSTFKISPSAAFKSRLYFNWFNSKDALQSQKMFVAEYLYYNRRYDMDSYIQERPICVVSPFRNLVGKQKSRNNTSLTPQPWKIYLLSLSMQNYSNYHIYLIDDQSQDNSSQILQSYINQQSPSSPLSILKSRLTLIRNRQNIGALGNRDYAIRNLCKGEIVIDVDGDDALIGRQVFNWVNRMYEHKVDVWVLYTNHLTVIGKADGQGGRDIQVETNSKMFPGICKQIKHQTYLRNTYRTSLQWVTSQLRTYLKDLYIKIPSTHLLQPGTSRYFRSASDRFSMYALIELAGYEHTTFINQFTYFYYQPNFIAMQKKGCQLQETLFGEAQARVLTPLATLRRLQDVLMAETIDNYVMPDWISGFYRKMKEDYIKCLQKNNISPT